MRRLYLLLSIVVLSGSAVPAFSVLPDSDQPLRTLYLIRHGDYDYDNDEDPDVGKALVSLGRQQARLVAERLDGLPISYTSLQASTMTRARQTAEILAEALPELEVELRRDIRECTPPTRRTDIMARLEPGEAEECLAQLVAARNRLFEPATTADAHDIIVCHGNVIRWLVCQALEVESEAWLGMSIANCSVTIIQIKADGSRKLICFADAGHIPYSMTTYPGVEAPQ